MVNAKGTLVSISFKIQGEAGERCISHWAPITCMFLSSCTDSRRDTVRDHTELSILTVYLNTSPPPFSLSPINYSCQAFVTAGIQPPGCWLITAGSTFPQNDLQFNEGFQKPNRILYNKRYKYIMVAFEAYLQSHTVLFIHLHSFLLRVFIELCARHGVE